jgi:hypothetical protein
MCIIFCVPGCDTKIGDVEIWLFLDILSGCVKKNGMDLNTALRTSSCASTARGAFQVELAVVVSYELLEAGGLK